MEHAEGGDLFSVIFLNKLFSTSFRFNLKLINRKNKRIYYFSNIFFEITILNNFNLSLLNNTKKIKNTFLNRIYGVIYMKFF